MGLSPFFFYPFALIALVASIMVIFKKNPVSSALNLVLVFVCFAAIYGMLGAHLLAAIQILVYTGAIVVLFVFVIMLLRADEEPVKSDRSAPVLSAIAIFAALLALGLLTWLFRNSDYQTGYGAFSEEAIREGGGNTVILSELMFSDFILPFELTSVLLLAAIVAAVSIAMRKGRPKGKTGLSALERNP